MSRSVNCDLSYKFTPSTYSKIVNLWCENTGLTVKSGLKLPLSV